MRDERSIAIDIGAESGRVIAGKVDGGGVELEILHRFPTGGVHLLDSLVWPFPSYMREIEEGLSRFAVRHGARAASVGADSWANSCGLLDRNGRLLAAPLHYRDGGAEGMPEKFYRKMPREKLYSRTGIQMMRHNLLYHLHGMADAGDPLLAAADKLLLGAELVCHFLAGSCPGEYTNVSTTQFFDVPGGKWALDVAEAAGIPARLLPDVVKAGTRVGTLLAGVAERCGLDAATPVVLPAAHDTGSAIAGIPAPAGEDWLYVSSGTWSLVGAEIPEAIVSEEAYGENFTNEGGVFGTIRFLKNVVGLWLIQECRREWTRAGEAPSYAELTDMAAKAKPFQCIIDVADERFLPPGPMASRIRDYCLETGQKPPEDRGAIVRACLEGLALAYRKVAAALARLTGRRYATMHIVGGGSSNALLNQFSADATGLVVKAGPVEATALGNLLMQAAGLGRIGSLREGRECLARFVRQGEFVPDPAAADRWREAETRLAALAVRGK